jgi:hypothetical protein
MLSPKAAVSQGLNGREGRDKQPELDSRGRPPRLRNDFVVLLDMRQDPARHIT